MVGTDRFANSTTTGSHSSIYVFRTDPAGNPLWAKSYDYLNDTNYDQIRVQIKNCVTQSGAPDGFIICGATNDNITGGIGSEGFGILLRIDNMGNQLWKRSYAPFGKLSGFKDVEQIEDGKFLVTGWAYSNSYVAPTGSCSTTPLEKREAILVKVGSTGAVEWWKQYSHPLTPTGEPVGLNCGLSLLVRNESICVVGDYIPFTCDPGSGNVELFSVRPDGTMSGADGWIRHFPSGSSLIRSPGSRSLRQVGSDLVFQCDYSSISSNEWSAALIRLDGDANVIGGQEFGNSESSYPAVQQSTGFVTEPGGGFTLVSKAWNGCADNDNRVLRTNGNLSSGCLENSFTPTTITPTISVVDVPQGVIQVAEIGASVDRNLLDNSITWNKEVICHSSTCVPDIDVTCGGGGGGSVELSWSPPAGSVNYVEVNRNGELIAVVDGTSFIDSPPSGQYHYELGFFNNDASCEPSVSSCEMLVGGPQPVGAITDLIVHATSLSPDDIAVCLDTHLQEIAREPLKVSNLDLLSEQLGAELTEHTTIVWLMLGEYPYQQPISESNQVKLVEFLLGGGSLYIEGADVGFTISDQLAELAGVSAIAPGFFDGVVNQLSGSDSGYGLDLSELSAEY
ncbi:MAG: hypothetical protein NZ802_05810, partial [Candidatus Poseidoniales archaeon]|nr:hypothetical protein [Candidatus Poseidoniales archaeon]